MSLSKFIRKLSKIALDSQKVEVKRVLTSFGFMSAPERGLLAALERIGLDAIRMKQENCVFPTLCTALSAGGLVFVGFINDTPRKSILGWLGVDPEMSNAEFAEVLKRIMSTVKQHSTTNKVYFQLAMRPKSGIDVDSSVLEQYLDAPLLVIEDPGTAPTLINNADDVPQCVICVAPHTSNWDFLIGKLYYTALGKNASFLMKKEWFIFPLGFFFRKIGGVPVDRSRKTSITDQMAHRFQQSDHFKLAVTPEGTRKRNPDWKKGFYYIALGAQIPIVLIGIDYEKKCIVADKYLMPSGDIEKDMRDIKLYFKNFKGKHPEKFDIGKV